MQGNARQHGHPHGNAGNRGGQGSPGQRTLTMSLPPRRGSSSSDEFHSLSSSSSSDDDRDERERAQRRLLDRALSPHLDDSASDTDECSTLDDDEAFVDCDGTLPPDERALFSSGDDWQEVARVEAETEERATNATPESAHNSWSSWGWSAGMGLGSVLGAVGMSIYNRTVDVRGLTQRAHDVLVAKLNAALNVNDAAVNGLRIDGGLITADSVSAGPLARSVAGYDLLCGGFTLQGLELQLTLTDLYNLYYSQKLSDSITIRFGSIAIPLLQVGTLGAQPQTQPSQPQASSSQPSSAKPLAENVRQLLSALRLGIHIGAIDVALHSQDDAGFVCGVTISNGALRVLPDSGAFKAFKELSKKHLTVDGALYTPTELRQYVFNILAMIRDSPYGPLFAEKLKGVPDQVRAALREDGWSANDRQLLQAVIDYIEGDTTAFAECDRTNKERDTRTAEADAKVASTRRADTARRIEALGDDWNTGGAAGHIHLDDIHGGVVGSQFAGDEQTRGRLHVGGVQVDGLATRVGGFQTTVDHGEVGPLDVRLLDDQLGVQLGGASVRGARGRKPDGTRGTVTSLSLGATRAAGRTGDVRDPMHSIDAQVHLGEVTATGGGGTSGDRSGTVERLHVGATDLDLHKRGGDLRGDAQGLATDLTGVKVTPDGETTVAADEVHLGPSSVHGAKTAKSTDGSVTLGELDVDELSAVRPSSRQHGHTGHLHVGHITASKDQHDVAVELGGAKLDDVEAHLGVDTDAGLASFELGPSHVEAHIGDLDKPGDTLDAEVGLGAMTAHGLAAMSGDRAATATHAYVGPTDVDLHKQGDHQHVDATGLAVNVSNLAGTLDANTAVSADSLRLAPSTVRGDLQPGSGGEGTVSVGSLDVDALSLDRPRAQQHAGVEQLHVGGATATRLGDRTSVTVSDLSAQQLAASNGTQSATVTSLGIDKLGAGQNGANRSANVGVGTVTAAHLDASDGVDGGSRGHADQLVIGPSEASVNGDVASFTSDGIALSGIEAQHGASRVDARRLGTGIIEGEHGPRATGEGAALDVRVERLQASGVDARHPAGTTTTSVQVADVTLDELHGRTAADGTSGAYLGSGRVTDTTLRRRDYDPQAPKASRQDWYVHEDKIDLVHAGVGHVGLEHPDGNGADGVGRRDLEVADIDVTGADMITRDHGDRHGHVVRKARYEHDKAKGNADAEHRIADRKATAQPPEARKKKAAPLRMLSKLVPHRKDRTEKADAALAAADKRLEKAEKKEREKAEKERAHHERAKTKDRGAHHHVGDLHVGGLDAELSGLDHDGAHVESASLGKVTAHGIAESKRFEGEDDLTAELEDLQIAVDDTGNGTISVRVRTGKHMLGNLLGKRTGGAANKLAGVNDNVYDLDIPVVGGVIQLDALGLGVEKHWLRKKLMKKLAKLQVGQRGQQQPALRLPVMGDVELEHLGLDGLQRDDKQILVSGQGDGGGIGGVHLTHLLENGLQALIDRVAGPQVNGLHNVDRAAVNDLSIDGVHATHESGARPTHRPADLINAQVDNASVGKSIVQLDSTEVVRQLMASLGAAILGLTPTVPSQQPSTTGQQPPTPTSSPQPSTARQLPPTPKRKPQGSSSTQGSSQAQAQMLLDTLLFNGDGTEHLASFHTAGGGDCGIHAMFGTPTPTGTVRAANPDARRAQLADALDGTDPDGRQLVDEDAFIAMLAEIVLQIVNGAPNVHREDVAFSRIPGFADAVADAREVDAIDYATHAQDSNAYADHLLAHVLDDTDDIGADLRQQLIDDVLVSNSESERALRLQLERAGGHEEMHGIILDASRALLRKLLLQNLDVMVVIASTNDAAPAWIAADHQQLQHQHAQLGGALRDTVRAYLDPLLVAYAGVVRTRGYYLHDEDLRLLAMLNDIDLHIYTEHDQHAGQFVEQLVEPGSTERHVFHRGEHYERAHRG